MDPTSGVQKSPPVRVARAPSPPAPQTPSPPNPPLRPGPSPPSPRTPLGPPQIELKGRCRVLADASTMSQASALELQDPGTAGQQAPRSPGRYTLECAFLSNTPPPPRSAFEDARRQDIVRRNVRVALQGAETFQVMMAQSSQDRLSPDRTESLPPGLGSSASARAASPSLTAVLDGRSREPFFSRPLGADAAPSLFASSVSRGVATFEARACPPPVQ